jgi:hypothetical protein
VAGLLLNMQVGRADENPWSGLDKLKEVSFRRKQEASQDYSVMFEILDTLLWEAEQNLIRRNIARF